MLTVLVVATAMQIATSSPPEQLSQVDFLVGKWSASIKGTGVRFRVERGPGRRSLRFELIVSGSGTQPFIDDGYLWWDKEPAAFRSFAMSSLSNDPRREIGRLADGSLVMVSEPFEIDGRSQRTRRTFKPTKEGLSFSLDFREGEAWKPQVTATLKSE